MEEHLNPKVRDLENQSLDAARQFKRQYEAISDALDRFMIETMKGTTASDVRLAEWRREVEEKLEAHTMKLLESGKPFIGKPWVDALAYVMDNELEAIEMPKELSFDAVREIFSDFLRLYSTAADQRNN